MFFNNEKLNFSLNCSAITLPNGTTFTAKYERISRKQLPINIHVKNARKIGPRRKSRGVLSLANARKIEKITKKKQVRFNHSAPVLKRMNRNRKKQSGKGMGENLAKVGLQLRSKALNSSFCKKTNK